MTEAPDDWSVNHLEPYVMVSILLFKMLKKFVVSNLNPFEQYDSLIFFKSLLRPAYLFLSILNEWLFICNKCLFRIQEFIFIIFRQRGVKKDCKCRQLNEILIIFFFLLHDLTTEVGDPIFFYSFYICIDN